MSIMMVIAGSMLITFMLLVLIKFFDIKISISISLLLLITIYLVLANVLYHSILLLGEDNSSSYYDSKKIDFAVTKDNEYIGIIEKDNIEVMNFVDDKNRDMGNLLIKGDNSKIIVDLPKNEEPYIEVKYNNEISIRNFKIFYSSPEIIVHYPVGANIKDGMIEDIIIKDDNKLDIIKRSDSN